MNIDRLRETREENNLTQKEVANILTTSQQQYSKYELGIRIIPIEKLCVLANYYNTSIDYLLGRTDEKKPYAKSVLKK